jgi:hemolysin activation/secretion protein
MKFLLILLASFSLAAAPPQAPKEVVVTGSRIKGILLAGSTDELAEANLKNISGIQLMGVDLPGPIEELECRLIPIYNGKRITSEILLQIREEIIRFYQENSCTQITLRIPEVEVKQGVVQLIISNSAVAAAPKPKQTKKVALTGNQIEGVLLAGSPDELEKADLQNISGLQVLGVDLPGPIDELERRLVPLYQNKKITSNILQQIREEIVLYYQENSYDEVTLEIPEMEVKQGIVQLIVAHSAVVAESKQQDPRQTREVVISGGRIKGVLLVGKKADLAEADLNQMSGVQVIGIDLPGSIEELEYSLAPLYENQKLSSDVLLAIKEEIILYYQRNYRPVVTVEIPEQEVRQGIVQLVVIESTLGNVVCQGNKHFRCGQLKRYIDLRCGEPIQTDILLSDVSFMNQNHFRRTDVLFSPGYEENTTDIHLITKDRFTWRFYTGGDNTGNDFTGNARWFGGFNWGNVFGLDHTFSYQYTASSDFYEFQAHTLNYNIPLPFLHHNIVLFGGVSFVHPKLSSLNSQVQPPIGTFQSEGTTGQASFRYELAFGKPWLAQLAEMNFGFDYKYIDNNLSFITTNSVPLLFRTVNLFQFVVGMDYGAESGPNQFAFSFDVYASPGEFIAKGTNSDFNNLRNRAKNQYIYARGYLKKTIHMPFEWCYFLFVLRGQMASGVLLPSEQFGLGGFDTVRGYDERVFFADKMVLGNFELRVSLLDSICWFKRRNNSLTLLGFFDVGNGSNYRSLDNEVNSAYLASIGPGLRYECSHYLTFRADYGYKLHKNDFLGNSKGKFHVGLIASY